MNELAAYLTGNGSRPITQTELAKRVGISRSYLSEIASGVKRPSLTVAFALERATGGAVPASSFVDNERVEA